MGLNLSANQREIVEGASRKIGENPQRIIVISSLSGMGKSTVAAAIANAIGKERAELAPPFSIFKYPGKINSSPPALNWM
jgi:hypothetical protein